MRNRLIESANYYLSDGMEEDLNEGVSEWVMPIIIAASVFTNTNAADFSLDSIKSMGKTLLLQFNPLKIRLKMKLLPN